MAKDKQEPARTARKARPAHPAASKIVPSASFPIVGIGASAGGLEAFTKLLQFLPIDTGMAFVLIQHLDPTHESILTSLLARATRMTVHEVSNRMRIKPNNVYVIPKNSKMQVDDSTLRITRRVDAREQHMPIDIFFKSLAASQKSKAIGVILSGTASDGTAGLGTIKSEGGISFAQEPGTARFDGMPRSAIAANVVDFVLPPEGIARELANLSRHPYLAYARAPGDGEAAIGGEFNLIFNLLRAHSGSDFSSYKRATIERRVRRRMALRRIEKLSDYVERLRDNPGEVKALYDDLLIHVTEFFRDPKTFDAIKAEIFPKLLKGRAEDIPIRIWIPGCSTGEEVYSIGMILLDFLGERHAAHPVQVFGTDISESAVSRARLGYYPEIVVAKVPPDFLQRYFTKTDSGYRIGKRVREVCVFARQDLTKDPPFSKVDMIACRNVLIYLGPDLQRRVLPIFHYALQPDGYLLLGSAESIGDSRLFGVVSKDHKIYAKKPVKDRPPLDFSGLRIGMPASFKGEEAWNDRDIQAETDRIVTAKYGPPGVVVNEQLEIVQFRGDISPYLQPPSGVATLNFLKTVRPEMASELRSLLDLAQRGATPVRREGLHIGSGGDRTRETAVEVIPVGAPPNRGRLFLVLFETRVAPVDTTPASKVSGGEEAPEIEGLREELAVAKKHLQFLIDERQASEEELRSANEEILSSNEELQSTNEELQTSQEELQSANEELTTVNDELHHRNLDLSHLSNDLTNLLTSVNIPIVMLGSDLHVRRFTPMAGRVWNLRSSDIGRPIVEINSNLEVPDLEKLLAGVIQDLTPKDLETQDRNGVWYSMRIRPYRTEDNKIDGAVVVLQDVDQLKRSLQEVKQARDFSQAIVETVPEALAILDSELRLVIANRAFYDTFHLNRRAVEGKSFLDLPQALWNVPAVRQGLERALSENQPFENFELEGDFRRLGHKIFLLSSHRIDPGEDNRRILLLSLVDITERKLAERQMRSAHSALEKNLLHAESSLRESEADLRQNREELRALAARLLTTQEEERRRVSRELHDDLNQKLAMLEMDADRLGQQASSRATPGIGAEVHSLRDRVAEVSNDVRRVAYQLHPSILDHLGLGVALRSYCTEFSKREGIRVKFAGNDEPGPVPEGIALCLYRVTQESLRNVAKHASAKAATVTLGRKEDRIHLCISDNGIGFDVSAKRSGGIGLLSIKERVRLVDGEFSLRSKPGGGTKIDVWAPLPEETK